MTKKLKFFHFDVIPKNLFFQKDGFYKKPGFCKKMGFTENRGFVERWVLQKTGVL